MYIIKNALMSISRAKGRNILIGIIALAIAVSSCIALSIKESAAKAREDTLSAMTVTAQISFDRGSMMKDKMGEIGEGGETPEFDRDAMKEMLQSGSALTLEEYETYATAASVKDSYYSLSVTLNASGDLEPIDTMGTFTKEEGQNVQMPEMPEDFEGGGKGGDREFSGMMGAQGDFTVVGYSGDAAMTDFTSGNCQITDGVVFDENTSENYCIITEELATYNNLAVGSEITLANPNNTEETFTFTVVGIYTGEQEATDGFMGGFSTATDSANKIMTSYSALKALCDVSSQNAEQVTDENTGMTTSTAVQGSLSYTYVFDSVDSYEAFAAEAAALGLSDDYVISSTDAGNFEDSVIPLDNLSKTANSLLLVVLIIGAIILIVVNMFNIRERKYEIGVLTAIGMKKYKVALQFVTELFVVTLAAIIVGSGIGAAVSVPVTNAMLSAQITANQQTAESTDQGFGRDTSAKNGAMTGMTPPNMSDNNMSQKPQDDGQQGGFVDNVKDTATNYIAEISYSTNLTIILQLIGVGVLLTLVSSLAAVLFIMRYEPLKILTSRD